MKILAIDTCLGGFSLAIKSNNEIFHHNVVETNQQSKMLADEVQKLLKKASVKVSDISTILITNGPGSFTGTRIGIAFVYGLGVASDANILASSTLCCLDVNYPDKCLVTVNAGRDLYYTQNFEHQLPIDEISVKNNVDLELLKNKFIIGHYLDAKCMPSVIKMIELYENPDYSEFLFNSDLKPKYIRESYF